MSAAFLFVAGFASWTISTLSGGGGSFLLVAAVIAIVGIEATAPVVTVASLMASPARTVLLWHHIDWRVVLWYLPGAISGAAVGGWAFTFLAGPTLQLIIAAFLISTVWQFRWGRRERSFHMRLPWFMPLSFAVGGISGLIGASGVLANTFYLNYGLLK